MNSNLLQIQKRNDTGIDPSGTFSLLTRKYRPDVIRSSSRSFSGLTDNAVMGTRLTLPLDSITEALTITDRIFWQGVSWDIVSIDPYVSGSRRMTITVSGRG